MRYKIVPPPGVLYVEPESSLHLSGADDVGRLRLKIVRCGPEETNVNGVKMPMKYEKGQLVLAFPKTVLPMPRGFMLHQDSVACVLEETDGEDEMTKPQITRLSDEQALNILKQPVEA